MPPLQKSFSTRCLEKALVVYRASTWTQAQFFVEHALGRQAYTMGRSDVAVEHFIRLLGLAEGQSGGWLDDFALAFQVRTGSVGSHEAKEQVQLTAARGNVDNSTWRQTTRTRLRRFRPSSLGPSSTSSGRPSVRRTARLRFTARIFSGPPSRTSTFV